MLPLQHDEDYIRMTNVSQRSLKLTLLSALLIVDMVANTMENNQHGLKIKP